MPYMCTIQTSLLDFVDRVHCSPCARSLSEIETEIEATTNNTKHIVLDNVKRVAGCRVLLISTKCTQREATYDSHKGTCEEVGPGNHLKHML